MSRFFLIVLAGALGTGARYLISLWAGERFGVAFPYGTLIVNVLGCFLMAIVIELSLAVPTLSPTLRLALTSGFLGGFTTYSSFNAESTALFGSGARGTAYFYVVATLVGCACAGLLGALLARHVTRP